MDNYINLRINKLIKETEDSITLELTEINNINLNFVAGQFLTFLFNINNEEIRRGYSISSSPNDLPKLRVTIKRVADGYVSDHIFDTLKIGDTIKSLLPHGNFTVKPDNEINTLVFIGAGSGITPLTSMINFLLKDKFNKKVYLFYGNRNSNNIIYKNEFNELARTYENNFNLNYVLSQPEESWDGLKGRITGELILSQIEKIPVKRITEIDFYLCGPGEMMKDVITSLKTIGVSKNNIHREIYKTSVSEDEELVEDIPRDVTIIAYGKEQVITVQPGDTVLQTALDAGIEIPNSCQYGSCSTCKSKLLSGRLKLVEQTALTEEEIEKGYCLTCVGYPITDNVVILYED